MEGQPAEKRAIATASADAMSLLYLGYPACFDITPADKILLPRCA